MLNLCHTGFYRYKNHGLTGAYNLHGMRVLVIDDDEAVREVLEAFILEEGYEVEVCQDGECGLEAYSPGSFDIVLLDLVMPKMGGIEVLARIREMDSTACVIIVTAHGTIQSAVEAIKLGAYEYITKPFRIEDLAAALKRASEFKRLRLENFELQQQLRKRFSFEKLVGDSPAMYKVFELIEKVSRSDTTVLITGESGTGKEVVAKTMHYASQRAQKPFIAVNCSAIPHELLESELFGHEKGAFTGAVSTRVGRFELAAGGTLFLDEIAEMPPQLQVKILRVLQEREFERVGGIRTIKADVRIIAATNRALEEALEDKSFREDLYYRLNVINIKVPPLRERVEDISLLINRFVPIMCRRKDRDNLLFSKEAMAMLYNYSWPGNVRELENLVERLAVLKEDDLVTPEDLPQRFFTGEPPVTPPVVETKEGIFLNELLEDFEKNLILKALRKTNGVKSRAAAYLNINRTTLIEKIKRLKIDSQLVSRS